MARAEAEPSSDVFVDFDATDGLLHVAVRNISERPAYRVRVTFDKAFSGLGGRQDTPKLRLFRNLEFLAPEKEIRTLVDTVASYFARRQPARITADVSWRGADGTRHEHRIVHDLSVYRELAYRIGEETHARSTA